MDFEYLEKLDNLKTKALKYIVFKKRTEKEVRQKFNKEDRELLEEVIEFLKEYKYLDDEEYIDRFVKETISLKNLSIYEIKYKLFSKGISKDLIEDYLNKNDELLEEYEIQSAKNIIMKKKNTMEFEEIKNYLLRKNFSIDSIQKAEQQ